MKQTSVQNLIINALLLVEAVLIVFFLLRMITKPRDKEAGPVVPDRELTIAEQEGEIPLPPVVGNSKPVDVQPVDGIRITAAENALDKDREFKITPVSDQDWDSMEKRLSEVSDEQMLFCFDLDAGMGPDEHLPGEFTLTLNLEKMGIPPILHKHLTVWRQAGNQLYKYTSWVENGNLTFRSDQNCFLIFAIPSAGAVAKATVGALVAGLILKYGAETWEKHESTGDMYKNFFTMNDDAVKYEIKDPYGDFTLYFRFKDTEYADRFDAYKSSREDFLRRSQELEENAEAEYKRQVEEKYNEERADWTTWQKIMGSAEAKRKARAAIDKAAILAKMCEEDILLKRYAEAMQLPPSILELEKMLKSANRFLTDNQCLRPQTCNLEVDLVMSGESGEYRRTLTKLPYLVLNYGKMLTNGQYKRVGKGESMLLTVTHELFHHRQKTHNYPAQMDPRSEESTAAYLENAAALYYIQTGEIVTNAASALATGKFVGGSDFDPAPRENYEYFGQSFGARIVEPNPAYTYADLMEYIQHQKKEKIAVKGGTFMNRYFYAASHKSNYMRWFDIKDENEFTKYVQGFCEENLEKIHSRQGMADIDKSLHLETYSVSPSNPVVDAKTVKGELIMRTFDIQGDPKGGRFHAFLVPGKACTAEEITFYSSNDIFVKDRKKGGLYFDGDGFFYAGAYFKPNSSALPFKIVALYAPDAPVIKKVKKNYVRFVLPKADKDMVKKGYITGALVRCLSADGTERYILTQPEKFGKEVKWSIDGIGDSGFSLRVKWIRQNEDGSTYESPLSKPAAHGALPAEKEEPVTESANVGKKKDVEKKPKASQEGEEKLVIYEKVRDLPWRAVNVSLYLDELEKQELVDFDRKVCHVIGSFGWGNGVDYPYIAGQTEGMLDKGVYIHHPIKGLSVNSNVKFVETGEGYTLSGVMKESGDADGGSLKDGAYQLDVTLVFDEDLKLLKGKFEGSSKQMRKITYYRQPSSNGKNVVNYYRDNPWFPTDMVYSGSFTAEEIYSDSNSELLYYAKYDSLNMQGNWKEDAYTANKQFGEAVVEKHFSKGLSDAVSKGIKVKIELIKCED